MKLERITVFKLTEDDWYPPFRIGRYNVNETNSLVEVSFLEYSNSYGWKVYVTGADDFSLEKEYPLNQRQEAYDMFLHIIAQDRVSETYLHKLGFVRG